MTNKKFIDAVDGAFKKFQSAVPNPKTRYVGYYINAYGNRQKGSTGNMAFNASNVRYPNATTAIIYVDENIAPYVPYTNEAWISPFWKGKKNPNEGWFERAAELVATTVAERLHSTARKQF